ncbi:MAG TPA: DUF4288 domain-containing protein [Planctomycetota bacterium]|nr:DUF4288 domain-containing protein [Planctomycetota bacterium]
MKKQNPRRHRVRWYGVRTLYRLTTSGRPLGKDKDYDPDVSMIEDRVVLFSAGSGAMAVQKAEREARRYASEFSYRNPYGRRVLCRYLGALDPFENFEKPGQGAEVYSLTEVVPRRVTDKKIIERLFGTERYKDPRRRNFYNEEFSERVRNGASAN